MIFWINSPFDPLPLEGGRPMRYELLSKALVKLGHEVIWWSSDFHHLRKEKRDLQPVYEHAGIQIRLVHTLPYYSNVAYRRLLSHHCYARDWRKMTAELLDKSELQAPDVIILSMPPLGLYDQASLFRNKYECKIVADVQDAWPENFINLAPSFLRCLIKAFMSPLKKMAERAYRGADHITAVADKYLDLAKSYGSDCPKKVFPLGCMLPDISRCPEASDKKLRLVYVGNLGPSYDLETMLCAVNDLIGEGFDLSLDIAGDGPRKSEVEKTAEQSKGSIRFHGYLSEEELTKLMRQCDVGIIPMRDDMLVAVPNKLVDYASHGLAVINGLSTESEQMLIENDCGLSYKPGDIESLKNAVLVYYKNRDLLNTHKINSRRMAEENFDAAKISIEMAAWIIQESS